MDVSIDILDVNALFSCKEYYVIKMERVKYLYTHQLKREFYIAFKTAC
jgi:hypothetical protein